MRYAMSLSCLGNRVDESLMAALPHSPLRELELTLRTIMEEDDSGGSTRQNLRKLLSSSNAKAISLHLPFGDDWDISVIDEKQRQRIVEKVRRLIEANLEFGAGQLTLHASFEPIEAMERTRRVTQVRRSITELLPTLEPHHLKLAVEWLPRTCLGNHETELQELVAGFDRNIIGIILDVNHLMERHRELPQIIACLAPRLFSLHLSDYDGVDEKHWLPGNGVIDWAAVLAALQAARLDNLPLIFETGFAPEQGTPEWHLRQLEKKLLFLKKLER